MLTILSIGFNLPHGVIISTTLVNIIFVSVWSVKRNQEERESMGIEDLTIY
jgi:hypothetical protein